MYCVDSWAWIEYFKGSSAGGKAAKYIESMETLFCTQLTLFEVYWFVLKNKSEEAAKRSIEKMKNDFGLLVEEIDDELIFSAAKIKKEDGLALADAFLMATARRHGAKVVTGDPDFKKFGETIFLE